jgi:hypothetical protein
VVDIRDPYAFTYHGTIPDDAVFRAIRAPLLGQPRFVVNRLTLLRSKFPERWVTDEPGRDIRSEDEATMLRLTRGRSTAVLRDIALVFDGDDSARGGKKWVFAHGRPSWMLVAPDGGGRRYLRVSPEEFALHTRGFFLRTARW